MILYNILLCLTPSEKLFCYMYKYNINSENVSTDNIDGLLNTE